MTDDRTEPELPGEELTVIETRDDVVDVGEVGE